MSSTLAIQVLVLSDRKEALRILRFQKDSVSLAQLHHLIESLFEITGSSEFHYVDDEGDLILVNTEDEFQEFVKLMPKSSMKGHQPLLQARVDDFVLRVEQTEQPQILTSAVETIIPRINSSDSANLSLFPSHLRHSSIDQWLRREERKSCERTFSSSTTSLSDLERSAVLFGRTSAMPNDKSTQSSQQEPEYPDSMPDDLKSANYIGKARMEIKTPADGVEVPRISQTCRPVHLAQQAPRTVGVEPLLQAINASEQQMIGSAIPVERVVNGTPTLAQLAEVRLNRLRTLAEATKQNEIAQFTQPISDSKKCMKCDDPGQGPSKKKKKRSKAPTERQMEDALRARHRLSEISSLNPGSNGAAQGAINFVTDDSDSDDEKPPKWFVKYMDKFRKRIVTDVTYHVTSNLKDFLTNGEPAVQEVPPCVPPMPYKELKNAIHELKKLKKVYYAAEKDMGRQEVRFSPEKKEKRHHVHHRKEEKEHRKCDKVVKKAEKLSEKLEKKHAKRFYYRSRESAPEGRARTESEASVPGEFVVLNMTSSSDEESGTVPQWGKGIVDCCSGNLEDSVWEMKEFRESLEKVTEEMQKIDVGAVGPRAPEVLELPSQGLFMPCESSPAENDESEVVVLPPEFSRTRAPYSTLRDMIDAEKAKMEEEEKRAADATREARKPTEVAGSQTDSNEGRSSAINSETPIPMFESIPIFGAARTSFAQAGTTLGTPIRNAFSGLLNTSAALRQQAAHPRPNAPSTPATPRPSSPEMEVLIEMGFNNRALNAMLLERHNRDIGKTVNDLIRIYKEQGRAEQ